MYSSTKSVAEMTMPASSGNEKKSRFEAVRSQRILRRRRFRCAREVPRLRRCIDQTLIRAYISSS